MPKIKLITKADRDKLLANSAKRLRDPHFSASPVVKLFNPMGAATWLISEIDPEDDDRAFGLCDLGMGEPELGYVSLGELSSVRLRFGLSIERDIHFTPDKTLVEYAREARSTGRINA